MLFTVLKKRIELGGLTEELRGTVDLFYALGRITEAQYVELISL